MKKDKEPKSKKFIYMIYGIVVFLCVLGTAFMIICSILKGRGYGDYLFPHVGVFGAILLLSIGFIIGYIFIDDLIKINLDKKENQYSKTVLYTIENFNLHSFTDYLSENFKDCDGFFRKKEFSLSRDTLCYYFRVVNFNSINGSIDSEESRFAQLNEKSKNTALTVILKKDTVTDSDLKKLKELGKAHYAVEKSVSQPAFTNTIPVIYETSSQRLYFFYVKKKFDFSVYSLGCKKLIKIAKKIG